MFATLFDWIFNTVMGQVTTIGGAIVILGLVGYFVPPVRKLAWTVALAMGGYLVAFSRGAANAKRDADEKQLEREQKAVQSGHDARRDAERDRAGRVSDGWQRD